MSNNENSDRTSSPLSKLLCQRVPIDSDEYGRFDVLPLTRTAASTLKERNDAAAFDADGFAQTLVGEHVRAKDSEERLNDQAVSRLAAAPSFLELVVDAMPYLYSEPERVVETDGSGKRTVKFAGKKTLLEREDDEAPNAFLLRAWHDYVRRDDERHAEWLRNLTSHPSLSRYLSSTGQSSLLDNFSASSDLTNLIQDMSRKTGSIADIYPVTRPGPLIDPPTFTNPVHETNERLDELVEAIADMRQLAVRTAEMQTALNGVATDILDKFVKGAEESGNAGRAALTVARRSFYAALAAIALTLGVTTFQYLSSGPSAEEIQYQKQMTDLTHEEAKQAAAQIRLLDGISEKLDDQRKQTERLAAQQRQRDAMGVAPRPVEPRGK